MLKAKPTPRSSPPPIMPLPSEILYLILSHLDQPRDLYRSSLVCKTWRVTATDAHLWEEHYWRFYRVGFPAAGSEQDRLLLERREQRDHAAMRAWFTRASSSSLPLDSFSPFITRNAASGENSLFEPLARGLLPWFMMLEGGMGIEVLNATFDFVEAEWKAHGPVDPKEATPRILAHLETLFDPQPTPEGKAYADINFEEYRWGMMQIASLSPPGPVPPPPFLQPSTRMAPSPDFHSLFRARMNADEQLLLDLQGHIQLQVGTLDSMLRIVARHGDAARDLLAALASDQRPTRESLASFVQAAHDHVYDEPSMRALDVHTRAAAGPSNSLSANCLSFQHAANNILAHLKRRDAVHSLQALQDRWSQPGDEGQPLRVRVLRRCEGLEEGIEALALFGHTERAELRHYLDLLALFVWTNFQAYGANDAKKRSQISAASSATATTRGLLVHITKFLRSVNFGLALEHDFKDAANSFPNVVLCCPVQRKATPTMLLAIVCAVARRLGVAATLLATPYITAAVVIEDGAEPSFWPGDSEDREWKRFFLLPIGSRDNFLAELGSIRACMSMGNDGPLEEESLAQILEPAPPTKILLRAAGYLLLTLGNGPPQPEDDAVLGAKQDFSMPEVSPSQVETPRDDLTALNNYLLGRSRNPPLPLAMALYPSSLSAIPSTHPRASRDTSKAWHLEALGMMAWLFRILDPSEIGGAAQAERQIASSCVGNTVVWGHHRGDLALLIEINGGDVAEALEAARQRAANGTEDEETGDGENDGAEGASPSAIARFIRRALAYDQLPCNGIGGSGREGPAHQDVAALQPGDESTNSSLPAQHRVGTLFKHRLHGYYGVVVQRESVCSAPDSWVREHGIDDLPGGRSQPFYHVILAQDATVRYFAHCNIEPLRISPTSSKDDVAAVLQELVPLVNLRLVSRMFCSVAVTPPSETQIEQAGAGGSAGGEEGKGGEIKLVLNEWMRGAWPYD